MTEMRNGFWHALRVWPRAGLLAAAVTLAGIGAAMAVDPVNTDGADRVAVHGYDAVAYFTEEKAVEGAPAFAAEHEGATYRFASAANRDAFAADPEKYAPQYGGYCAYAVANGSTADIDPEAWTVHNGKLYLNYSKTVRFLWKQDIEGNIRRGDANWPVILRQ